MKVVDLAILIFSFLGLVRKYSRQPLLRLTLPRRHLCRVQLELGGDLLNPLVTAQSFQSYARFELV